MPQLCTMARLWILCEYMGLDLGKASLRDTTFILAIFKTFVDSLKEMFCCFVFSQHFHHDIPEWILPSAVQGMLIFICVFNRFTRTGPIITWPNPATSAWSRTCSKMLPMGFCWPKSSRLWVRKLLTRLYNTGGLLLLELYICQVLYGRALSFHCRRSPAGLWESALEPEKIRLLMFKNVFRNIIFYCSDQPVNCNINSQ